MQPSFWGEALPKIHKVGLSILPAQNTYGEGPTLPYPNPTDPQKPKTQLWATDPTWAHLGVQSATPILGPWASDPKGAQFWGVQFLNPPILGPFGATCSFFSFRTLTVPGPSLHQRLPNLWLPIPPTAPYQTITNSGGRLH